MRFVGSARPTFLIILFCLLIFSSRLNAGGTKDWNNIEKVLNQQAEVYYGQVEGRFILMVTEKIVGFDNGHIYTACVGHTHKHDRNFIRAVVIKRKTLSRILALFILSKDEIIYVAGN